MPPRGNLLDLWSQPRMFWETILTWGGSSTDAYGGYLWGPTIVALLLGVSVQQAAAYFVFVSAAGVTGKIIVTLIAPLTGRRALGVIWGLCGSVALAFAGFYHSTFIGVSPGARSSGLGQTAKGIGKIIGPMTLALIAGTSGLAAGDGRRGASRFPFPGRLHGAGRILVPASRRRDHGKAMVLDHVTALIAALW